MPAKKTRLCWAINDSKDNNLRCNELTVDYEDLVKAGVLDQRRPSWLDLVADADHGSAGWPRYRKRRKLRWAAAWGICTT
jgi:hypothetical protein